MDFISRITDGSLILTKLANGRRRYAMQQLNNNQHCGISYGGKVGDVNKGLLILSQVTQRPLRNTFESIKNKQRNSKIVTKALRNLIGGLKSGLRRSFFIWKLRALSYNLHS